MKIYNLLSKSFLFLFLLTFVSCDKYIENTKNELELKKIVFVEALNAQLKYIDAYQTIDKAIVNEGKNTKQLIDSADVFFRNDSIIIDYGAEYVVCPDGNRRKGKIIGYYANHLPYTTITCIVNIAFVDFWIEDFNVIGSMTATNIGISGSRTQYSVVVNQGSSILKDGLTTSISATYNIEWDRNNNQDSSDDKLFLSSTSYGSGTASNGSSYTMNVSEEVVIDNACEFKIIQGKLRLIATSYPTDETIVSFGDGICDSDFIISISYNGHTSNLFYSLEDYL